MEEEPQSPHTQAALFHGELGWHNNSVEHIEPLNNIVKEVGAIAIGPGWIAPGGYARLKDPVEHGWERIENTPAARAA